MKYGTMKGERILIDTSVWIDYFTGIRNSLTDLTDDILAQARVFVPRVVIAELIQGAKSEKEIKVIEEFLNAFTIVDQSVDTWLDAGKLSFTIKKKGLTVHLVDCYIALIASEHDCKLLTLDKHFRDIKKFHKIEIVGM